jgi:hypothetical protein
MMVVMVAAMMVSLGKSGGAQQHDHREQQSLLHAVIITPICITHSRRGVTLLGYAGSTASASEPGFSRV